jgi:hypothetical protein
MGPTIVGKIIGGNASSDCRIIFSPTSGSTVLCGNNWFIKII